LWEKVLVKMGDLKGCLVRIHYMNGAGTDAVVGVSMLLNITQRDKVMGAIGRIIALADSRG